LCLT
jgi:hypothetical protein